MLQKYYFPVQPACRYLPEKQKIKFNNSIRRNDNNDKIAGIMEKRIDMIDLIDHVFMLRLNYKVQYDLPDRIRSIL